MRSRDIPNLITLLRFALVPPFMLVLVKERFADALWLFVIAGVSDALDGFLAKRYAWTSRLGSILDPLADKALLVSAYLALGWLGLLPAWLVAGVIGRDVVIILGAVLYHLLVGRFHLAPSRLSKLNTLCQIVLVLAVIVDHSLLRLGPGLIQLLILLTATTTLASGAHYIWTWGARAAQERREKAGGYS